jgi:hypothetical protein
MAGGRRARRPLCRRMCCLCGLAGRHRSWVRRVASPKRSSVRECRVCCARESIPPALDQPIRELLAKEPAARPDGQARDDLIAIRTRREHRGTTAREPRCGTAAAESIDGRRPSRPHAHTAPAACSGRWWFIFQLFSQLVLYVMILVAGLAIALAMSTRIPTGTSIACSVSAAGSEPAVVLTACARPRGIRA